MNDLWGGGNGGYVRKSGESIFIGDTKIIRWGDWKRKPIATKMVTGMGNRDV